MPYGGNVNILVSFYIVTLVIFSRQVYEPLEECIDCSLMFFFVNVGGHISISHWISSFWSRRPFWTPYGSTGYGESLSSTTGPKTPAWRWCCKQDSFCSCQEQDGPNRPAEVTTNPQSTNAGSKPVHSNPSGTSR